VIVTERGVTMVAVCLLCGIELGTIEFARSRAEADGRSEGAAGSAGIGLSEREYWIDWSSAGVGERGWIGR
jgi:hypothetical protein